MAIYWNKITGLTETQDINKVADPNLILVKDKNSVDRISEIPLCSSKYVKYVDNFPVEMTAEEKIIVDTQELAQAKINKCASIDETYTNYLLALFSDTKQKKYQMYYACLLNKVLMRIPMSEAELTNKAILEATHSWYKNLLRQNDEDKVTVNLYATIEDVNSFTVVLDPAPPAINLDSEYQLEVLITLSTPLLYPKVSIVTQSVTLDYTYDKVVCNSATPFTLYLPLLPCLGQSFSIINKGAGSITLDGNGTSFYPQSPLIIAGNSINITFDGETWLVGV